MSELRKDLTTFDGIALLIGITIGSGIYSTPYLIAGYFGSYSEVMITWFVVAAFVMMGGLIYAELGTRIPTTGGEYSYISRAYGPFAGFLFGWAQLFIIRTSPAAGLAIIASDYIGFFVPLEGWYHTSVALGIIALLGVFNYVGVKWSALFQRVTTVMKVGGLLLFSAFFLVLLGDSPSQLGSSAPPLKDVGFLTNLIPALMLIVFTHTGFDRVGYVAGEMKNPRKVIPKSMIIGLVLIILIYVSMITIYHYVMGMEALRATTTPAASVASMMLGPMGASVIALLAIISAVSSINGTMLSSSRVYYAMARDGIFFKSFDFIHPRFRTPTRAIIAHCFWGGVILVVRGSFENIAAGMIFAILIFYTMTTLALFKFRRENVGEEPQDDVEGGIFKVPFYPVLPIVYLMGVVGLLVFRVIFEWEKSMIDLAFVLTGLPVSWFWFRHKKTSGKRKEEEGNASNV
ncbi:MAG: amino acid permease [Bacteroidetes Order II. Incertae sedis bacterium]|jgi:basic amino acid/polyamine antiporter, APA family|nr:amino acid permease [Bacteroidetes Order II. bacterium]MBT4602685.1 amino acid permease [Bacteroidetes Order II. bacterium]MBT5250767.1 amino acid permease [Bacteroidetes Order II. bacterium]MBT6199092.1 amino acid permease [Bacteroidetes Order II. bacterium]MBT6425882.1 amino acid permease [Bacteroidetes Order II. bacterium]